MDVDVDVVVVVVVVVVVNWWFDLKQGKITYQYKLIVVIYKLVFLSPLDWLNLEYCIVLCCIVLYLGN